MARTHSCHEIIPLLQHHTNSDLNNSYSEDSSRSSNDCFTTLVQVCHEEKQFHGQKKVTAIQSIQLVGTSEEAVDLRKTL